MAIIVREARPEDVEGVARVHVQGWHETYAGILNPSSLSGLSIEERAAMWGLAFSRPYPDARFLVAEEPGGGIVGFCRGGPAFKSGEAPPVAEAEIYAIYLLDRVKRRGVGRRLLAGVFEHLSDRGFASAGLWVLKDNTPSRRFYEALGGRAGEEKHLPLRGQTVIEIAYRFEPIPRLSV